MFSEIEGLVCMKKAVLIGIMVGFFAWGMFTMWICKTLTDKEGK